MRKVLLFSLFIILSAISVVAQDKVKISVGYVGSEFKFDPTEVGEYLNGVWVDVDGRIVKKGNFRVGGVLNFQRTFDQKVVEVPDMPLPTLAMGYTVQRDTDTYSFGPRLSYRAGPVEPFAAALFGFKNSTDVSAKKFVRRYQVGVDIPFYEKSNFFIRPFFLEYEFTQGFAGGSTHKYGAGAGFRF